MPRKVLISFLGNSKYTECIYEFASEKSLVVRHVQDAILQLFCKDWTKNDRVFIFLTDEAKKGNWEGGKYDDGKGLKHKIEKISAPQIQPVEDVPKGFDEKKIWEIFQLIFDRIEEEDEIYFDITHAFRSLPMLVMVLLNYAKALKNITVSKIIYGAFEKLGAAYEVREKYPDPKDRVAPIIDLSSFAHLQDWTVAANEFISFGNTANIASLTKTQITPILAKTMGKDTTASELRQLSKNLEKMQKNIYTNRGKDIVGGEVFLELKQNLDNLAMQMNLIPPLKPLFKKIKEKVSPFEKDSIPNWFEGVKWCSNHGLIQQGITQMQEGIITHICAKLSLDIGLKKNRELVSQALNISGKKIEQKDWLELAKENKEIIDKILLDPFVEEVYKLYSSLTECRNDINHGGYLKKKYTKPEKFDSIIARKINELEKNFEKCY